MTDSTDDVSFFDESMLDDEYWPEEWPSGAIRVIEELEAERDRLRVECEAWRAGRLSIYRPSLGAAGLWQVKGVGTFKYLPAAVDALMAERDHDDEVPA